MAPPGPGTMAQVCTLGYCHRANAGRAASRAAQLEQVRESRLPWPCPPTAQREGEADSGVLKEAVWEVFMGRPSMPASLVYPTHLLSSPPPFSLSFCHLLLIPTAYWPTLSYHSLDARWAWLHARAQEWCQETAAVGHT